MVVPGLEVAPHICFGFGARLKVRVIGGMVEDEQCAAVFGAGNVETC
jgi:hypothetical protein